MLNRKTIKWLSVFLSVMMASFACGLSVYAEEKTVFSVYNETENEPMIMVSLGDSYSSGEGVEPFYGQDEPTYTKVRNEDWIAHRSENSWPGMLKIGNENKVSFATSNINFAKTMVEGKDVCWYFKAASGAETIHLIEYTTKERPTQEKTYKKEYDTEMKGFLYNSTYNLPSQLDIFDELEENSVDYVTLTIGGNDAHFEKIINKVAKTARFWNLNGLNEMLDKTWDEYDALGGIKDRLIEVYFDVSEKAGEQAEIIVAGYPTLFEASLEKEKELEKRTENLSVVLEFAVGKLGEHGGGIAGGLAGGSIAGVASGGAATVAGAAAAGAAASKIGKEVGEVIGEFVGEIVGGALATIPAEFKRPASYDEAVLINQNVAEFNDKIEEVVGFCDDYINIHFVSVEEKFKGHEAYSDEPYINPIYLGAKEQDLDDTAIASSYSMHPNLEGQKVYAKCVQDKINQIELDKIKAAQAEAEKNAATEEEEAAEEIQFSGMVINPEDVVLKLFDAMQNGDYDKTAECMNPTLEKQLNFIGGIASTLSSLLTGEYTTWGKLAYQIAGTTDISVIEYSVENLYMESDIPFLGEAISNIPKINKVLCTEADVYVTLRYKSGDGYRTIKELFRVRRYGSDGWRIDEEIILKGQ